MNFTTTQENSQALVIPEIRKLQVRWNDDAPDQSFETVYVVKDEPDKEILVFFLLDETADGRFGFSGPWKGIFDGDLFPRPIKDADPILKTLENMRVHRKNMDAIATLLNAEYSFVRKIGGN